MRVLVTGCAGFIGWKVSEYLLAAGYEVVGVDNLNDAYDVRLKRGAWPGWRSGRDSPSAWRTSAIASRWSGCSGRTGLSTP